MISFSKFITNSTTSAVPVFSSICIFFGKYMPFITVSSLYHLSRRRYPSPVIFFRSHGFEVIWIYARRITTKMIYLKTIFNFTLGEFIRKSMGSCLFFISYTKKSVTVSVLTSDPFPTCVRLYNFIEKSLKQWFVYSWHSIHVSQSVIYAK